MKRLFLLAGSILTLLLLVLMALALLLTSVSFEIDATRYKDRIVSAVRDRVGLEIGIDQELRLKLGPKLGFRAQGLRILNPALEQSDALLVAELAAIEVETIPLLQGKLRPTTIDLERAEILVERDRSGRLNWTAQRGLGEEPDAGESDPGWLIADGLAIRVRDSRLSYRDRQAGTGWQAKIDSADIEPGDDALRLDLDGSVDGYPVRLQGTTATLSRLIESEEPIPLDLSGNLLGLSLDAKGFVANPATGAAVDATLTVTGKSLAGLRPWVGSELAGLGPVKAKLAMKGGGDVYELAPFDLSVGKGRFDGSLKADLSGERPRIDLELGIEEIDIRPFLPGTKGVGDSAQPPSGTSGRLFSDIPFATAWMGVADVAARLRVRNLVTLYSRGRSLDVDVLLKARRLSVDLAGKAIGDRSFTAKLEIDGSTEPIAATLRVKGDKLIIEPLVAATAASGMITGDLDLSLDVRAAGGSADRLARSLNGELLLLIKQAEADLTHLDRLTPGVRNLFGQLARPRAKLARVNCGLVAFELRGGRTQVRALVDTPDSTTVAHGHLDLGAETLEIRVVPDPKGVNLQVSAPLVLYGSLSSPDYRVEKGGTLVSLTDLVSKIAVPQLLLVDAFGDAVADNPCVKIATGEVEREAAAPLETLTEPVGQAIKGAGAVVEGTGKVIKEAGSAVVKGAGGLLKGIDDAAKGLFGGSREETNEERAAPIMSE